MSEKCDPKILHGSFFSVHKSINERCGTTDILHIIPLFFYKMFVAFENAESQVFSVAQKANLSNCIGFKLF